MRIHAFRGTRYSNQDEAGPLAGPPYDQIDEILKRQLHREPLHFAHLIRPASADGDPHRAAAQLHQRWLETGVLTLEPGPALFPYEIQVPTGHRRLGICALVGIEDPAAGVIRPHEATMTKTVDERLSLLRETRIDLEPILILAEDQGGLDTLLEQDLQGAEPIVRHVDANRNHHLLYRIDSAERIAIYERTLSPSVGLIADGHHRYTVASRYAEEIRAEPGSAPATKLAVITSLGAPGVQIDPFHRRLEQPCDLESATRLASSCRPIAANSGVEIASRIAAAGQLSLGFSIGGRTELWSFSASMAPDSLPDHLRHLSVGWLHDVLMPALGLDPAAATDGTVTYRSDPDRLYAELLDGSASAGFWLPPMSGDDFARAMQGGSLLPPKSTRFLPKVASGLVWAGHDDSLS